MQILLLGRVAVVDRAQSLTVGSVRQATVLAVLAGHAGRAVPISRLVDAVWGEAPPVTARNTLQVHVSALRRLLGPESIEGLREAYRYCGDPDGVDVLRFSDLVGRGRALLDDRPAEAARVLRSALALYRGDLLAEVSGTSTVEAERERLRRLRRAALLARVDADLSLGRHRVVVDELLDMSGEWPYDEEVVARLMVALYRSGAPTEALEAHTRLAACLRTDLGIAPGPRLRSLCEQVLRHDESLLPELRADGGWRVPLEPPDGSLVGREALLLRLESDLGADQLHTLVGPAGVGKTRLAIELAARCQAAYDDGAVLVRADGIRTTDELLVRLSGALVADQDCPPTGPSEQIAAISAARAVVVIDGLEPSSEHTALLDELLLRARGTFVVTSVRPTGARRERIWTVPALDVASGAELLLDRARHAGASLPDDPDPTPCAARCARLLDGLPLAIELMAPLAVSGLAELVALLEHGSAAGAGARDLSFASSLEQLGPEETELVDLLASAVDPVDAELIESAGLLRCVGPLVRDGLVVTSPAANGRTLFRLVGAIGRYVVRERDEARARAADVRLVALLAATAGSPPQHLPMQSADAALRRRLVAMEAALVRALGLAHVHGLVREGADLALHLPELHYATHGSPPPSGRADWLLAHPGLDDGRRIDLLLSDVTTEVAHNNRAACATKVAEALELARRLGHDGRLAVALAQRDITQLLLATDLGSGTASRREAVRIAESTGDPVVLAATLCLLYPTPDTPPDLADTLERALAAARTARHGGLEIMASANLAMALLDRGEAEAAGVHAREAAAMALELHHRGLVLRMLELAESADVLASTDESVLRMAESLEEAAGLREFRRLSEGLLRLAAGLDRLDRRSDAARALGLYDALLVSEDTDASAAEAAFAARWLGEIRGTPPRLPVHQAVVALMHELGAPAPALVDRAT